MKRQLCLWLVLCGTVALGASNLTAQTTVGSLTKNNIALNWSAAGAYGVRNVSLASSTNQWGYYYSQRVAFNYLNPAGSGPSPFIGWHNYNGATSAAAYLNSLVICSTTCSSSRLTFTLAGTASLEQGTGAPVNPWRAPNFDTGYYLSTPDTSSSITITFPAGKFAKNFDFYWGSADTWNSVTFIDLNNNSTTFTGADLCPGPSGVGCFGFVDPNNTGPNFDYNGVVVDFSAGPDGSGNIHPWQSVVFTSSAPAFEFDNIRWLFAQCTGSPCTSAVTPMSAAGSAPVSEPSSMALIGTGIAGISLWLRSKLAKRDS